MKPAERLVLTENMDALWAEEILRDRGGSLSNKEVYWLTKMATGDEDKAQDARAARVDQELRAGQTPEY